MIGSRAWFWYERCLSRRPVLTKCISRGACYLIGDAVSQKIECERARSGGCPAEIDERRVLAYSVWGGLYAYPQHHYFNMLHRLTSKYSKLASAAICTVANAMVLVPLFLYPTFFYCTGLLRGKTLDECTNHLRNTFCAAFAADLLFWVPTEAVIFYSIPLRHQVLAFSGANAVFAVILSAIAK
eukprot:TRINITY_DN76391_c0_g1_i1.p1 TRINITY_DN76391_c0_g1~~TRINITY_DN76391_c0_g1_i1.p1  ORF type:complete len:184 (-),score=9.80 TRINITY_DN76391_c0_g1_i1:287-838(-)